jgi:hypothetical protein
VVLSVIVLITSLGCGGLWRNRRSGRTLDLATSAGPNPPHLIVV